MNWLLQFAMRLAGAIAGRERAEWTAAMAAELISLDTSKAAWAAGCLAAAVRDRFLREWRFLVALLLSPAAAMALNVSLFAAAAPFLLQWHAPSYAWVILWMGVPLSFTALVAACWPARSVFIGITQSLLVLLIPILLVTLWFGAPLSNWFSGDTTIYNLRPLPGIAFGIVVWTLVAVLGAKVGSLWKTKPNQR